METISAYTYAGLPKSIQKTITVEDIIAEVKRVFGDCDLTSKSRKREVVWARQAAMYLLRKHTSLSFAKIGNIFGNKDHSTVIYSKNKVVERLEYDKEFREIFNKINI